MRARQLSFLPPPRLDHGGGIRPGRRKLARPIDPKRPLHVTMRASQARGTWSMLDRRVKSKIYLLIHEVAAEQKVKIYRFANVGTHLHVLVLTPTRSALQSFLRIITGKIAFLVTGAKKGHKLTKRFWDQLVYSRIVSWGREFDALKVYLSKNMLESLGNNRKRFVLSRIPIPDPG